MLFISLLYYNITIYQYCIIIIYYNPLLSIINRQTLSLLPRVDQPSINTLLPPPLQTNTHMLLTNLQQPMQVKAVTWKKDSDGLFDYQSRNFVGGIFKFKAGEFSLLRNNETLEVIAVPTEEARDKEYGVEYSLLTTTYSKKEDGGLKYYVSTTDKASIKSKEQMLDDERLTNEMVKEGVYLIVRGIKNPDRSKRGHPLEIGEKIKMGKVEYSVIELKANGKKQVSEASRFSFRKNVMRQEEMEAETEEDSTCRICMDNLITEDNFLFSPCKCSGSCKFIHLNCLRKWMSNRVKKEAIGGTSYYNFDKFFCEICKMSMPKFVTKQGQEYQLLEIDRPKDSYMIIEETDENKKDLIVISNIPSDGINMGRGHLCQIGLNDITVSRLHAKLSFNNSCFTIQDSYSKFGTLVKLVRDQPIEEAPKAFQIGRTIITIVLKTEELGANQQLIPPVSLFSKDTLRPETEELN